MKLEDIDKKNIFKKPEEDYFDKLPMRIRERIDLDRMEAPVALWLNWKVVSAAAMLFVAAGIWFFNMPRQNTNADPLATVSEEAILLYLQDNGVTTEELVSYSDVNVLLEKEPVFNEEEALEGLDFLDYELEEEFEFM